MLKRRTLGRTGLSVSELGFGCAGFWGRPYFSEHTARTVLDQAIASGINYFDTGPSYGDGTAESRLGQSLRARGSDGLVISTKVGTHIRDGKAVRDHSREAMRTSVRRSLERLGLDAVDVLYLQGCPRTGPGEELLATLTDLKAEGRARHIGLNSFDAQTIRTCLTFPLFDCVMTDFNIIRKGNAQLIRDIAATGAAAVAAAPLAQGLYRRPAIPTSFKQLFELARTLKYHRTDFIAARRYDFLTRDANLSAEQLAIAYVLRNKDVSSAVFATTSPKHLGANLSASGIDVPDDIRTRIESLPDGADRGREGFLKIARAYFGFG